jgi:hypothetical protein
VSAVGVQIDDVATITVATFDSASVGRVFRVAGLLAMSMSRDQRLLVDEVTK